MNLTGRWIGETQGCETRTHHWVIIQRGNYLNLYTRWEDEPHLQHIFESILSQDNSFTIHTSYGDFLALITEKQGFIVHQWVFKQIENYMVPAYDVVFRRKDNGFKIVIYRLWFQFLLFVRTINRSLGTRIAQNDPFLLIK